MSTDALAAIFEAGPVRTQDVVAFREHACLGGPSGADVEIRLSEPVDPEELLGQKAQLAFGRGAPERYSAGVVDAVTTLATPLDEAAPFFLYRLRITSEIGLLDRSVTSQIFQDMDVKAIVSAVLEEHGIEADRQSWRLSASYPKREYCVQYNESALAFIARLLEGEGIYFFCESSPDGETVVFSDDSTRSAPIEGGGALVYNPAASLGHDEDAITEITEIQRVKSGKFVLRDFDWKHPDLDLTVTAASSGDADLEVYDYPGLYTDPKQGERLARVRLEAAQAGRSTLHARGRSPLLAPGRSVALTGAPRSLDGEYVVTQVEHELRASGAKDAGYVVEAELVPKSVRFRSPLVTPSPVIEGPQTAVVVAPAGAPAEEIHTDEHGRCKVKFHWDLSPVNDDKASCWMRVSQLQTSGSMALPRVGWEVVVEFLEGNPDRPMVTGRLYNGQFMPPYALPEGKTRTAIQTASSPGGGGRNEIRLEDKAGAEEMMIAAQKNQTLATANNKTKTVGANESRSVKVTSSLKVGAKQDVKVTSGYLNTVKVNQTVTVAGNREVGVNAVLGLTAVGSSMTVIGGNQSEMDGNPLQGLIDLAVKTATELAQAKASELLDKLEGEVQSQVDQMMGPINDLKGKMDALGDAMDKFGSGNLGAIPDVLGGVKSLPKPGNLSNMLGGAPDVLGDAVNAGNEVKGAVSEGRGVLEAMVQGAIQKGADKLGQALGQGGSGGGGASGSNAAGPDGAVGGNAASDSACGPGHAITLCDSAHTESVGGMKVTAALSTIDTSVKAARTQSIGVGRVELVLGNRVETCSATKTESALGLAVVSPGAESETVGGSRTTMVGGGIADLVGTSQEVNAGGTATFAGIFHKVDAGASITFKCGASEVVIDGGGVSISSPLVTITAGKVALTKDVSEV